MTQTRPIPTKAVRLIPLLGSPVDNEALAAARGIGRVLTGAGLEFTDLAQAIPTGPAPIATHARRPTANRTPVATAPEFHAYRWRRAYTPRQEAEHRARVRFCQGRPWCFSQRERAFLDGVGRLHGNLTIRQGDWLAALTDRLDQELRCA